MPGISPEDVILLIDTSRSMMRKDFGQNRLLATVSALHTLIRKKFEIDSNDRLGLVTFGSKARKLCDLTSKGDIVIESLKKVEIGGESDIADGLALSMQVLATEIRKIGGKVVRIILFSDDRLGSVSNRVIKLANAAKGLGIFVDCLVAGIQPRSGGYSVMKNIATITAGDFAHFSNANAYMKAIIGLSSKKDLNDVTGYIENQERAKTAPLLSEIAVDLRRPNIQEIQAMIADPNKVKCSICYKATSPTGQASYASIRFCPSCSRAMHVQCTNQWAKNSPDATDEVFRCPFCYYLLRNSSASVIAALAPQVKPGGKKGSTTFMLIPAADVPDINQSCAQCHVIFMGEHDVYKCESCGSYYHKPCVQEIQSKYGACKVCGKSIRNVAEITK